MNKEKAIASLTKQDKISLLKVKTLLTEKPGDQYSIDQLSKKASISRIKLTYGFKFLFGTSIHQLLIKTRIEVSQELLHTTDKPIKAIARQCGYKSTQHFRTAFKKFTGESPAKYRKNI